jgi:hypothetical protein
MDKDNTGTGGFLAGASKLLQSLTADIFGNRSIVFLNGDHFEFVLFVWLLVLF